jgi:hypothetical protein
VTKWAKPAVASTCAAAFVLLAVGCSSAAISTFRYKRALKSLERPSEYCSGKDSWVSDSREEDPDAELSEAKRNCIATFSASTDRADLQVRRERMLQCMRNAGWSLEPDDDVVCLSGGP